MEADVADPSKQLLEKFNPQNRYSNFGSFLSVLKIKGFRGLQDVVVNFKHPITVISGLNGAGKSTIGQLAVCAYKKPSTATEYKRQYIKDFFPISVADPKPIEDDSSLLFQYTTDVPERLKDVTVTRASSAWSGYKQKKDVVFVSMEKKTDWFHRSGNQVLYPRFELVNEFSLYSESKSFHIINLSEMLKLFKADETIIKEIRNVEIFVEDIRTQTEGEEYNMGTLQILKNTIADKVPIQFNYNRPGKTPGIRTGNPHAVFIKRLKSGEEQVYVHVWQTGGVSDSGPELPGWRQFFLNDMSDVMPLPDRAPFVIAPGYNSAYYEFPIVKI